MKHHALTHPPPIVIRHRRPDRRAMGLLHFSIDHFLLLPIGAAVALVWCNAEAETYFRFAHASRFLVNDVGMAFFFALMAQEVVEALMPHGALHSWRRWSVAVIAAIGGIGGAALSYLAYVQWNHQPVLVQAWPVACAIDVAVAYYLLKTINRGTALLPFVLLTGITTNVFGVIVVAAQRGALETRAVGMLFLVLVALGLAMLMRAWKVPTFWPYLAISGTISWWAFYWIGVYPALAFLPIVPLLPHEPRKLDMFAPPPDDDAVHEFEHEWNHLVQIILFFFGLVNAGVLIEADEGTGMWALVGASLVGRPVGMLAAIGLAVAAGLHLPPRIGWRDVLVAAFATSSGFTFALFYASGLLPMGPVRQQITMGVLASTVGVLITFLVARAVRAGRYESRRTSLSKGRGVAP